MVLHANPDVALSAGDLFALRSVLGLHSCERYENKYESARGALTG